MLIELEKNVVKHLHEAHKQRVNDSVELQLTEEFWNEDIVGYRDVHKFEQGNSTIFKLK